MGNKNANKRVNARRAAAFLAALGVLVMSSGVALMVAATPANAAPADKIVVCKYVSTPGGHLDHIVIVSENTLPDEFDGTFPFEWTDAQGQSEHGSIAVRLANEGEQAKDVPATDCPQDEEPPPGDEVIAVDIQFVEPSCDNNNTADYFITGDDTDVTFEASAAPAAGATITVTATAKDGFTFAGDQSTYSEEYTYAAAEDCSEVVETPTDPTVTVDPPKTKTKTKHTTTTVTPTVVHAGLTGATVEDMRSEQGLALVFAGMVMLVAAGGLGMRLRGGASRI